MNFFPLSETAPLAYGGPSLDPPPMQQHDAGLYASSALTAVDAHGNLEEEKIIGDETLALGAPAADAANCSIAGTAEVTESSSVFSPFWNLTCC